MKMYVILRSVRDAEMSCPIGLLKKGYNSKNIKDN